MDDVTIDLEFSEEVDVKLIIIDFEDKLVKNLYSPSYNVTDPDPKVWDGKDNDGDIVSDGIYTIKITIKDLAGNEIIDESKTITLDTTGPTVTLDQISSDEWMVDEDGLVINAVCDETDCIEKKLYVSDTDDNCEDIDYASYNLDSPQTLNSGKWVCAAAKDDVWNIAYSTKQYFKVSTTIQGAIDIAAEGDVINVAEGIYEEDLVIDETKIGLELMPFGSDVVTIKGIVNSPIGDWPLARQNIDILADGVKIHGFTIESPDYVADTYSSGIVIGGSNVEIYNNNFIVTSAETLDEISQAIQTYNGDAFDISGLNIHDNVFTGTGIAGYEGIYVNPDGGSESITIERNTFDGNIVRAISTLRAKTNILNNVISNNLSPGLPGGYQGININVLGIALDIFVTGNTIGGIGGFTTGIYVSSSDGVVVNNNIILGNTIGVANYDSEILDATFNWWGNLYPSDDVEGNVDYTPFAEDTSFERFYAPILDSIGNQKVNEGSTLSVTLSASDLDGDDLFYSDNVDFGSWVGNIFTWTPTGTNQGDNSIAFTVSDGDLEALEIITVTVNNVAPEVEAGEDQTVDEGEEVSFTGSATDAGNDELTYSWNFGDGETSDAQNPTHTYADDGVYTVTLTVTDDDGGVSSEELTVTVVNFIIKLQEGWNLVSIPVVPENITIEDVLGGADVSAVYTYEPLNPEADNGWLSFSNESGSLETMTAGYGYWVYADSETVIGIKGDLIGEVQSPPSRDLTNGWNLIGYYGVDEDSDIYCSLFSLIDSTIGFPKWSSLFGFDADSDEFEPLDFWGTMYSGEGYWIFMTVEDLYAPATNCWDFP